MPLINPITEPQIPQAIARDTETAAAINAHATATDPHPIYLTQTEGDGRYRQTAAALTDSDIPAAIARDAEVTAAINAHATATDPHPIYLTQTEGDGRYRQTAAALTDSDIPAAIARDAEVTAAINAHATATDPHPIYLTQTEGYNRYGTVKKILITGARTNGEAGGVAVIAHNLNSLKIAAVNGLVELDNSGLIPPGLTFTPGLHFEISITSVNVHIHNMPGSQAILDKPVRLVIDYLVDPL